jgi:hypothetical protein
MICTKESARSITRDWQKFSTLVKEKEITTLNKKVSELH